MDNVKKYTEELSNLHENDRMYVIYNLLLNNKVSFATLSDLYVQALRKKEEEKAELICELGFSLVMYKNKVTGGTWEQAEVKANKALIESRLFKGTEYERKLLKTIK